MESNKNPSNRHSLPKVIISDVDKDNILEFKVKYEKLGRLDKFKIVSMKYEDRDIVFRDIVSSDKSLEFSLANSNREIIVNLDNKKYTIRGQRVDNNEEKAKKVQLILTDNIKDENGAIRETLTERELIDNSDSIYSKIAGRKINSSKDIYLIKRYLAYRSNLQFFYNFIDKFFKIVDNKELWNIEFGNKHIEYFKFLINDNIKNANGYLYSYLQDNRRVKNDLYKTKDIFSKLRHALMHFDYEFFDKLFNNENLELDLNIEFLNLTIQNIDKLNIDTKKSYIGNQKIKIYSEEIKLDELYNLYNTISINRLGFNRLINSFFMQDGLENRKLKEFFNEEANSEEIYFVDIHQNRDYKKLYIKHKNFVAKLYGNRDGKTIARLNRDISNIKKQMQEITDKNSTLRLEYKLRVAFGFIYTNYKNYMHFENSFDNDLKSGRFNNIDLSKIIEYYKNSYTNKDVRIRVTIKKIDKLNLNALIKDDNLLKIILLIFTFIPNELKGEFLGFIKRYYHDIKHIDEDSKEELEFNDGLSTSLKLKILHKNIRKLTILKYSLATESKYNKKDNYYYEDGHKTKRFLSSLGVSHNIEEFDKTIYTPFFKYYSAMYKLINDFEIFALTQFDSSANLKEITMKEELKQDNEYNFKILLRETNLYDENIVKLRNKISHIDGEFLFSNPLNRRINISSMREKITNFIDSKNIKKILGYDALNDLSMKIIQQKTKLEANANKDEKINELIKNAQKANDYYSIYKLKAIEGINKRLLKIIGETKQEKYIKDKIIKGNNK